MFGWLRKLMRRGLTVDELARRAGLSVDELKSVHPHYVTAWIPKRSGGTRRLDVPDRDTKRIQRLLLDRVFARLRSHAAACGFEPGRSIVDGARPHCRQAVVIRLDIQDFFPSTSADRLQRYFRQIGWGDEAADVLVRLTTYDNGLPQGAPTSPRLSNLVNYRLDARLAGLAARRRGQYTRYADDMTISLPRDSGRRVRGIIQQARRIVADDGYRLHEGRKLHVRRRHQRQEVLGLVVNDGIHLPRETRRWLRAVKHHADNGRPTTLSPEELQGWLAYASMIESAWE